MRFTPWIRTLPLQLRSLFRRREVEQDLDEELQYHLERGIQENIARGMGPDEARYAAIRAIGGLDRRKEECREVRGVNFVDNVIQDLRYAGRVLRRAPGFTAMAVSTLALGIGGIATIFTVVNGVLLRPLPYDDADRLLLIAADFFVRPAVPPPEGTDWPYRNQLFDGLTWIAPGTFTLPESETPLVSMARVPPGYFSVVRAKPAIGRDFVEQDAAGPQPVVAILSHGFWQQRLGGDPNVIGKTMKFSEAALTVVGVMPPRFRAPFYEDVQLWMVVPKEPMRGDKMGRMKAGLTPAQVETGINGIIKQVEREFPQSAGNRQAEVFHVFPDVAANQRLLLILFGSVGFILLIAIINVANLMLSRALTRERELAIRAAIGAGRRRIIRQLLTESLLLAMLGGGLGLGAGYVGVKLLVTAIPQNFPRIHEIHMDPAVVGFVLLTTLLTSVAFGVLPAFASSKMDVQSALKDGFRNVTESRRKGYVRQALITIEVALAAVLLIGAALTGKSFWKLLHLPLGFQTENVIAANLRFPPARYRNPAERAALYANLSQRLTGYPEVEFVSFSNIMPAASGFPAPPLSIEGSSQPIDRVIRAEVTDDYFRTMGITFIAGRALKDGEQTAVINETLARQYWPGSSPIGSRIKFGLADGSAPWLTIVGVIPDVKIWISATLSTQLPQVFSACSQCNVLLMKDRGKSTAIVPAIRRELAAIDKTVLITRIQPMDEVFAANALVLNSRFRMALFLAFAGAGLLLAFAGVYGVTSYSAAQRTQEVGIRMALGATRWNVLGMMMRQSMMPLIVGIVTGLAGASALAGLLESYLFEVAPTDHTVFFAVPILLALVALAANFIPARRSTRVDPMVALRHE